MKNGSVRRMIELRMNALRRYFHAQIEEIRADTALRLYGAFVALGQTLGLLDWFGKNREWYLSNQGAPICWPLFENCFAYRFFSASEVTPILWLYCAASVVGALLFLFPKRCGLAYWWLIGVI